MEHRDENTMDNKSISKAKSCSSGPPIKLRSEEGKKRPFNLNEAVLSLDLALGKIKKSKLNSEYEPASGVARRCCSDRNTELLRADPSPGVPNSSLMSMNFSHYELMRNLSRSTATSEGACSGATGSTCFTDNTLTDERLEKYFRSVEMWDCKYRDAPSVHFEVTEK